MANQDGEQFLFHMVSPQPRTSLSSWPSQHIYNGR
jgi:hypothetical protein